jgi:predicted TIM-barrel fold metal-dependent hydrolase
MRVVTLEEHVTFPEMIARMSPEELAKHPIGQSPAIQKLAPKLADVNGERLQSMDANGITVQVLSVTGAGADLLQQNAGPLFASTYNDLIARQIAENPTRFKAFAHLPMTNPEAAAKELERTVTTYGFCGALINGLTHNEFLDDAKYAPIFEMAQRLDVPIYLHPGLPPQAVVDAYYSNLPKYSGMLLSIAGWGWHSETAIHVLRLIVSGTFDKYPGLKLIIGHMGEMLPMMMERCSLAFKPGEAGLNQRTVTQTLRDQVYITTSGLFTLPPLMAAIDTFGIDRVMFSVDYPFSTNEQGKQYLESMQLSTEDMEKIAHGNADKLLKLQ